MYNFVQPAQVLLCVSAADVQLSSGDATGAPLKVG
jgi:hypothetical protein